MWQNAHDAYLESRVLSAEPVELVRMLYQAALRAVGEARRHLAAGEIRERSLAITRAYEILVELTTSLDHGRGGEISRGLALLYDYIGRKLIEANLQQSDAPLAEVLGLLATLGEAWEGVTGQKTEDAAAPRESPWADAPGEPVAASSGSHGWSL